MEENKSAAQKLEEGLIYKTKNVWEEVESKQRDEAYEFCEGYKKFLDISKTEREFVENTVDLIKEKGFISFEEIKAQGIRLETGMRIYNVIRNKAIILSVIGLENPIHGVNLLGAHIDSPRIDIKQNPLYEDSDFALLKTHYYGGIKKYQWVTIPLAMHGVVIKKDGQTVKVNIGEAEEDPVFTITDLLPHLAQKQMQEKMSDGITGESLNILFGSVPYIDDEKKVKEKVKLNILNILNEKYGIVEEDFLSAELEIVPAFKAKDIGLDRGLVGAYGQDDRVCAYTSVKAMLDMENPKRTAVCVLTDKEEVGSMGNTGAQSRFLENFLANLCNLTNENYNDLMLRNCLDYSKMLSSDVDAGYDPTYPEVSEKRNAGFLGRGVIITKFTGSRGKSGASDANAEYVGEVRKILNDNNIIWHTAELGKVDLGGGGTIAQYVANLGMDVVDCGVPILSMHAPFEVASKIDIYMAYKAYIAFLMNA